VEQWVRQALELPGLHLAAPRRQDGVPGQDGFFYFLAMPPRRKEGQRGKTTCLMASVWQRIPPLRNSRRSGGFKI
jgi:hypothetical protein